MHFNLKLGAIFLMSFEIFTFADLIGQAMSEFTGVDIPFKQTDFGQYHGMKILSWTVRYCLQLSITFSP